MKVRMGFVSNSSTSSFCIIGVSNNSILKKLMKAEKVVTNYEEAEDDEWLCGVKEYKVLTFVGSEGECYWAGMEAEPLLQTMTIPQACQHVQQVIKEKLDIDVPLGSIKFIYDEISTG